MSKRVLIPIADGSEDLEAVTLIDVLRRAEFDVVVASVEERRMLTCARGTRITADTMLLDVLAQDFDLIVLPGSKSVQSDLAWLRAQGWEAAIRRHLRYGGKLLGICGGLQMLGQRIADPLGLEGAAGASDGLGLLDFTTELHAEKQLRNVRGRLCLEGAEISGYEIHAGVSEGPALRQAAVELDDGRRDGRAEDDRRPAPHDRRGHPVAGDALLPPGSAHR